MTDLSIYEFKKHVSNGRTLCLDVPESFLETSSSLCVLEPTVVISYCGRNVQEALLEAVVQVTCQFQILLRKKINSLLDIEFN